MAVGRNRSGWPRLFGAGWDPLALCLLITIIRLVAATAATGQNEAARIRPLKTVDGERDQDQSSPARHRRVGPRQFPLLNKYNGDTGWRMLADGTGLPSIGPGKHSVPPSPPPEKPSRAFRRSLRTHNAHLGAKIDGGSGADDASGEPNLPSNVAHSIAQVTSKQVTAGQQNDSSSQSAPMQSFNRPNDQAPGELKGEDSQKRLMELKQKYMTNRAVSDTSYYMLLLVYSLFIIVGAISNSLICLTVILKPKILSPRNIFIVNLAGSDLLLCVFTMPFSFIEMSMKMWQLGTATCKLVAGLQATSIYVSTISITAIALDRHKVIVNPTHQETAGSARSAAFLLASIWIGALLLSTPLFTFRTVQNFKLRNITTQSEKSFDQSIKSINFCIEKWPFDHGRGIYSVISMIFQYVLPITIVSLAYASINQKLKKRLQSRQRLTQLSQQKRQSNLINKTHSLLIYASVIFGCSWLPLNLLNVIGDFSDIFSGDSQQFRIVFAICHLIGCSSACSNPILYGYYNKNFRKEFHQVYQQHAHNLMRHLRLICCCCPFARGQRGTVSLQASNSSNSLRDGSTDLSSYASGSGSARSSDNDDDEGEGDAGEFSSQEEELTSVSSLERRIRPFNGSRSANALAEAQVPRSPGSKVYGSKNVGPASAFEMSVASVAAGGLDQCRSGGQVSSQAANNYYSPAHYYSFQTIPGGRRSLAGRTVRFCLCISGSDSTETIGAGQQTSASKAPANKQRGLAQPNQHRFQPPVSPNPSSHCAQVNSARASPVQFAADFQQQQQRKHRLQSFNEPLELLAAKQKQLRSRRIRRRRRRVKRYRKFVNDRCQCQCHSAIELGGFIKRRVSQLLQLGQELDKSSWPRLTGSSRRGSAADLGRQKHQHLQQQRRQSASQQLNHQRQSKRISIDVIRTAEVDTKRSEHFCDSKTGKPSKPGEEAPAAAATAAADDALHGRRVWLRFFPAIERYCKVNGAQEEVEVQPCNRKLAAAPATRASKQSVNNASVGSGALGLIGAREMLESDRHFNSAKSEESVLFRAGNFVFGQRAKATERQPNANETKQEGQFEANKNKRSWKNTLSEPDRLQCGSAGKLEVPGKRARHCASCRRKVALEYRKLLDASKVSRARKRAKSAAAAATASPSIANGSHPQLARSEPAPARKQVALDTGEVAQQLGPPIGVELLSVVLPSNERSTSDYGGQEQTASSALVLNATDSESQTRSADGDDRRKQCTNDVYDCEPKQNADLRAGQRGQVEGEEAGERLAGEEADAATETWQPINGMEAASRKGARNDDNNNNKDERAGASNMQISGESPSGQVQDAAVNQIGSLKLASKPAILRELGVANREEIICSTGEQATNAHDGATKPIDFDQTQSILPVLTESDRKNSPVSAPSSGKAEGLLDTGKRNENFDLNNGDINQVVKQQQCQMESNLQAQMEMTAHHFAPDTNNNDKINQVTGQQRPINQAQVAPIGRSTDQPPSHTSSGSSLCACIHMRSYSCTCSMTANSSSSFGSSSIPNESNAGSSSASSNSSSSSMVSASSLTSSQQQLQNASDPLPGERNHLSAGQVEVAGFVGASRPSSSSFSTGTAPRRPDTMSTVAANLANSTQQLSAPATCQPSTTGSPSSMPTTSAAASELTCSASGQLKQVPTDSSCSLSGYSFEFDRFGRNSSAFTCLQAAKSQAQAAHRDEQGTRKLSAGSCGSPTGTRHLATINERSFGLENAPANGSTLGDCSELPVSRCAGHLMGDRQPVRNAEDGSGGELELADSANIKPGKQQITVPEIGSAGRDREKAPLIGRQEMDPTRHSQAPDSTHYVV